MENVNYNHLYYFHVVAESGSLGAAARKLSVTKPTISTQVRQLEDFLETPLFDRRGGRLRLNEAGRAAYRHTRTMFDAGRSLMRHFRGDAAEDNAMLRVGVSVPVARSLAATFFTPLLDLEDTMIKISSGDATDLRQALQSFELDLLLVDQAPPNPEELGVVCELLSRRRMVAVTGSAGGPEGESLEAVLRRLPLFHYLPDAAERWEVDHFLRSQKIEPRLAGETDDVATLVELAATGKCVAFVPETVSDPLVTAGTLRTLGHLPKVHQNVFAMAVRRETPSLVEDAIVLLRRVEAPE